MTSIRKGLGILTVNGLAVLIMMVKILRGAQEIKKTAERRVKRIFVLLLLWEFLMTLCGVPICVIFLVDASKIE